MLALTFDLGDAYAALRAARDAGATVARLDRIAAGYGVQWGVTWTGALQVVSGDGATYCGDTGTGSTV